MSEETPDTEEKLHVQVDGEWVAVDDPRLRLYIQHEGKWKLVGRITEEQEGEVARFNIGKDLDHVALLEYIIASTLVGNQFEMRITDHEIPEIDPMAGIVHIPWDETNQVALCDGKPFEIPPAVPGQMAYICEECFDVQQQNMTKENQQ